MRIVNRNDFIKMPPGTLFSKYEPHIFGDLCIKEDSILFDGGGNDFYYVSLAAAICSDGSDDLEGKLNCAEKSGDGLAMDFRSTDRDGLFEEEQLFAVWEYDDVASLVSRLTESR